MNKRIFLIAGEHSGDALGGRLMASLGDGEAACAFSGVGGPDMAAQGLQSFIPMEDLCVMGIIEVLKHYPRLRRLGFQIIEEIERTQPDMVVTIDLPDFNFRVAKLLKKRGVFKGKIVHYVAPSVWAWRPGRAKKIAQFLDGLMCLFPFEPAYFTKHGLHAEFVGHSLVESGIGAADGARFKARHGIEGQVLGLFFGSRSREIETLGPVFQEILLCIVQNRGGSLSTSGVIPSERSDEGSDQGEALHVIAPTVPGMESMVEAYLKNSGVPYTITTDPAEKYDAFKACDAAVAASGTVGLELAYAGVPHVIAYKMHPLSWALVKWLVKTKYAHLVNILLDKPVVPEFLQGDCKAEKVGGAVLSALHTPDPQKEEFLKVGEMLTEGQPPSEKAARFLFGMIS